MFDPALIAEIAHYERRRGRIAGREKRLIAQPDDAAVQEAREEELRRAERNLNEAFLRAVSP